MRTVNPFCKFDCKIACVSCRKKKHRANDPVRAAYTGLKSNAKQRHIPFSITFGYWVEFCKKNRYIELKGRFKEDMTIDRIKIVNPDGTVRGYDNQNIQMITKQANNKKQSADQKEKYKYYKAPIDPDVPF